MKLKGMYEDEPLEHHINLYNSKKSKDLWHKRRVCLIKRELKNLIKEKTRILDIGCGDAFLLDEIKKINPNIEYIGLDLSKNKLIKLRKLKKSIFICGDAENLPFNQNSFDLIIAQEIIEHVPSPTNLLNDITRVLKKKGKVIIATPSDINITRSLRYIVKKPKYSLQHLTYFSEESLLNLVNFSNLKIIKKIRYGFTFPLSNRLLSLIPIFKIKKEFHKILEIIFTKHFHFFAEGLIVICEK